MEIDVNLKFSSRNWLSLDNREELWLRDAPFLDDKTKYLIKLVSKLKPSLF